MFIDDNSIKHILKSLNDLINFCAECETQTSDNDAWELYCDTKCQLENIYHDVATSDWDEEDDEEDEDEEK